VPGGRLKPTRRILVAALIAACIAVFLATVRSHVNPFRSGRPVAVGGPRSDVRGPLWLLSDRGLKTELIANLQSPPKVVVLGGSRALRFNPAYIQRKTGLPGFNAAVPHAIPEDEWAYVNLMHQRFPTARFRFLWVIHVDEFDQFHAGPALLEDPLLAQFLPSTFVGPRLASFGSRAGADLSAQANQPKVVAPNGFMIADRISAERRSGTFLAQRVAIMARAYRTFYASTPPRLDPVPRGYFAKTLALMEQLGGPPTIVLAPLQPRFYTGV
jgi:hypothetical protein